MLGQNIIKLSNTCLVFFVCFLLHCSWISRWSAGRASWCSFYLIFIFDYYFILFIVFVFVLFLLLFASRGGFIVGLLYKIF